MNGQAQPSKSIYYVLRIACAMCFIGHGSFGILGKAIWCNYFGVFGISQHLAYQLMPVVGWIDITMGIVLLFYPLQIIPLWLAVWGFITALLRPLSGEPLAEFFERAGNFGAPFALLLLTGFPKNPNQLFCRLNPAIILNDATLHSVEKCLKVVAFFLLLGHGWLNLIDKKALLIQYISLGSPDPGLTGQIIGVAEILAAFLVLMKPTRQLVWVLLLWKMASELFYPAHELFEWIERGGSYGTLLALWLVIQKGEISKRNSFQFQIRPDNKLQYNK